MRTRQRVHYLPGTAAADYKMTGPCIGYIQTKQLKESTRDKRGKGVRKKVSGDTKLQLE